MSSDPPLPVVQCTKTRRIIDIDEPSGFFLTCVGVATIFALALFHSPTPFKNKTLYTKLLSFNSLNEIKENKFSCDVFQGTWVRDHYLNDSSSPSQPPYTSSSCATIPEKQNCFKHGRKDSDFLGWRWEPDSDNHRCRLPRFEPKTFLELVRGKTMGFVGDSVARNHMDSLLCHLSQVEVAEEEYKDAKDRNRIFLFPRHGFTLRLIWTKYLVAGEERIINGSLAGIVDLRLDEVDVNWAKELHNLDYAIISTGQWFFRPMYLHEGPNVISCVYCKEPDVADWGVEFAIRMVFRAALGYINRCDNCTGLVTLTRTYSPTHFENGAWNTGGTCNRTTPFGKEEIDLGAVGWELRKVQVEEIARAEGERTPGKKFGLLDVTRAMLMRPDGHPGAYWRDKRKKGYNDCVHWCLPGPIDLWNDFLLAVLNKIG